MVTSFKNDRKEIFDYWMVFTHYYVAQFKRGSYGVLGGIEINCNGQILGKDDLPIHGLYATGNDANNIYGFSYPFALSGNTSSFVINMGRIAGQHAAQTIRLEE